MIKKLLLVVCVAIVSACSTTTYENFNPTLVQGSSSMKFVSQVPQKTLIKDFISYNGGKSAGIQYGFAGALVGAAVDDAINSSRWNDAESVVEPFRHATLDLDVRKMLEEAFASKIEEIEWVASTRLVSEQLPSSRVAKYIPAVQEDLLLLVNTRYSLKPNTEVIEFTANYALYDKTIKRDVNKRLKAVPLYQNVATVQSYPYNGTIRRLSLEEQTAEAERLKAKYAPKDGFGKAKIARNQKNLAKELSRLSEKTISVPSHDPAGGAWLANDARLLREEMVKAPAVLAKMIINDLSGQYPLPGVKKERTEEIQVLEISENGMVISRQPNGNLLSKYQYAPLYTLEGHVF